MRNKRTVFIGLLTLLLVISVAIFAYAIKKTRDVEIVSRDEKAVIILDSAAANKKRKMESYYRYRFIPKNNLYKRCVFNNKAYLYSIEADGSRSLNETGKYLLYKDNRYFLVETEDYIEVDGTPSTAGYYTELLVIFRKITDSETVSYQSNEIFLPVLINKGVIESNDPVFFKWSDTVGLTSFEDLKEYYTRIEDDFYSVDEEKKCIVLNNFEQYHFDDNNAKGVAELYATDEGITLVLGKNAEYPKDSSRTITYINGDLISDTGDSVVNDYED